MVGGDGGGGVGVGVVVSFARVLISILISRGSCAVKYNFGRVFTINKILVHGKRHNNNIWFEMSSVIKPRKSMENISGY